MKIVILAFAYVALPSPLTQALDHEHQHGTNQVLTRIHRFSIPPETSILIRETRNGVPSLSHRVAGTLHRVPAHYLPADDNGPYEHAFVIINWNNYYHARLEAVPIQNNSHSLLTHNEDNETNTLTEVPSYYCYIRRPPYRGLQATLRPVSGHHLHDIPHVHYVTSDNTHLVGDLTHVTIDDLSPGFL